MDAAATWETVLFLQERFHTNQHPIVKKLQEAGHEVSFLALRQIQSEVYLSLRPEFVEYSKFFRLYYMLRKDNHVDDELHSTRDHFVHKYGLPRLRWYRRYLTEVDPGLIVSKGYNLISFLTLPMAKSRDIDVLFYDQDPVYGDVDQSTSRRLARGLQSDLLREPFVRYSPVRGDKSGEKVAPNAHYLPFVAEPHPRGDKRTYAHDGTVRVVTVGKFTSPRKNHIPLVQAVQDLANDREVTLTLIGELEDEENEYFQRVRRTIADSDISDDIDIRTNLSYYEVQQAYLDHDVYVLPSARERAAVSHLEAMAHGLPVICSETNGTSCYVEPGGNGYLVPPGDRVAIREKLARLTDDELLAEFGQRSYELARTEYSGGQFYEQFTAMLEEHFAERSD